MRNLHKNVCFKTIWRLLKQLNKIKIWQLIIRIIFLLISSKLEYLENLTENKLICSMYNCSKHLDFHRHISWSFSSLFCFLSALDVLVCFVDIGGIIHHCCLNFLFRKNAFCVGFWIYLFFYVMAYIKREDLINEFNLHPVCVPVLNQDMDYHWHHHCVCGFFPQWFFISKYF